LDEILQAPDRDDLLDWLRQQPLLHHDAHLGVTMIHAGLAPQWTFATARACAQELASALRDTRAMQTLFANMYGNQPDCWSDNLRGMDRLRFITNCFARLRVCDAAGRLDLKYKGGLAKIPAGFYPWFRAPHRRSTQLRIVFGHWSAIGYYDGDGVRAIDAGCVWGERLCAIRLDKTAEPVFVKSHQPKRIGD
jgi:bis(5'-nucleosyl)-tetraphosphatase (symmetrical)